MHTGNNQFRGITSLEVKNRAKVLMDMIFQENDFQDSSTFGDLLENDPCYRRVIFIF